MLRIFIVGSQKRYEVLGADDMQKTIKDAASFQKATKKQVIECGLIQ